MGRWISSYAGFYIWLFYLCCVAFPDPGVIWVNSLTPAAQTPRAALQTVNNGTTPAGLSSSSHSHLAGTEGHFMNHKWQLQFQNVEGWEVRSPVTSTVEGCRSEGGEQGRCFGWAQQMQTFLPDHVKFWRKEEEEDLCIVLTLMKECRTVRHEILFLRYECEQTVRINRYSAHRVCYLQCAVSRDAFLLTLKGSVCVCVSTTVWIFILILTRSTDIVHRDYAHKFTLPHTMVKITASSLRRRCIFIEAETPLATN